jgi:hypothetical protein
VIGLNLGQPWRPKRDTPKFNPRWKVPGDPLYEPPNTGGSMYPAAIQSCNGWHNPMDWRDNYRPSGTWTWLQVPRRARRDEAA